MTHYRNSRFLTGALLVYMVLYIVLPVSSLAGDDACRVAPDAQLSFTQGANHTWLYMIDLVLWFQLKHIRHSVELGELDIAVLEKAEAVALDETLSSLLPDEKRTLIWSRSTPFHAIFASLSRSSEILFARSGISPPYPA